MNDYHKFILKSLRKAIVDDVDIYNGIIIPLQSEYILREEDAKQIKDGATKEARVEILLDILPSRGPHAFDAFRQALKHHYGWHSESMDKLLILNGMPTNDMGYFTGFPIVPPISPLTVTREEKTKQLKRALETVEPNGYIALHGMKGFGKSCLTASTFKDTKLVRNLFNNEVYWLQFGYKRTINEEILIQLNTLYHFVKNPEIFPESFKRNPLKEYLVQFLKHHFRKEEHRNALLILDDVYNEEIMNTFDFGCKTLVITSDIDVLYGRNHTKIELNDGFTEAESLGLFAQMLDTQIEKLPPEAKLIHEECKGMPLLIAMFSAQFEEFKSDMNLKPDRWKHYLDCLRKKDATNKVIGKFLEKQEAIFDMCIEHLPPDCKERYELLAIFNEDVNIMPKTLEIVWEGEQFRVEEMMLDLCHKSLAAKQWNNGLNSYVYGVHDLLLCHLQKKMGQQKLTEMHKCFIEKYRKYCNNDFSKLPGDNYSYSYIGHHLEQAQLYEEFSVLYLNFDFLQSKIMHTGLSDLLIDLKKYRKYITKNYDREYELKVADLEIFLQEQASILSKHRRTHCLDLIQTAMNHPYSGYIADTAKELAKIRSKKLYLCHDKKHGYINMPLSEEVSTEISTSCFAGNEDIILIGNDLGEIILWDCTTRKQNIFSGHSSKCTIKKILVSEDVDCFLALSDTGVIKLFRLNYEGLDENRMGIHSPRQKQTYWSSFFTNNIAKDDSILTLVIDGEQILDMTFGHEDKCIAACTNKGTIRVWDRHGTVLSRICHNPINSRLEKITFTEQDVLLHTMDQFNGVLVTYSKVSDCTSYEYRTQFNPQLQGKKIIFFCSVACVKDTVIIVTEDKLVYVKWFRTNDYQIHSYKKQSINVENEKVFVCAAITSHGRYLALADSGGFINIWDAENITFQPVATYKSQVNSLDTLLLTEGCIICGSENRLLHRWNLPTDIIPNSVSNRKPLYDAVVQPFGQVDIIAKKANLNKVVILLGDQIIAESKPTDSEIVSLNISSNGKKVVYVTEKGCVYLFDVDSKIESSILELVEPTDFVRFLYIENDEIIICRHGDSNLMVWQNVKVTYSVTEVGYIIAIYPVSNNCVLTVTKTGEISIYYITGINWTRIKVVCVDKSPMETTFSSFNKEKNVFALLLKNQKIHIYNLVETKTTTGADINVTWYHSHNSDQKLTCCEFSPDGKYLAIGFENGDILVIDVIKRKDVHKLLFHTKEITQLHWAPSIIDIPVLLSVNNNELVWWNIALASNNEKQKQRSRFGIKRSLSNPSMLSVTSSSPLSSSKSAHANIHGVAENSEAINNEVSANGTTNISAYWKQKAANDPKRPALLANVQLPPSCAHKVCMSRDFSKFLTVDIHGSISTFKLFEFPT